MEPESTAADVAVEQVRAKIRDALAARISLRRITEEAGIGRATLIRWRGDWNPNIRTLRRVETAIDRLIARRSAAELRRRAEKE